VDRKFESRGMKNKKIVISNLTIFHIRVIKISMAIFVTLIIATFLGVQKPILPALIAGLCIKPTFFGGIKYGFNEIKVTFFSALYAIILFGVINYFLPSTDKIILHWRDFILTADNLIHIISTTLVVTAVVTYCMSTKHYDLIPIAILTALYLSIETNGSLQVSIIKKASIFIGIIVATIINASFITIQYNEYLKKRLIETSSTAYNLFKQTVESFIYFNSRAAIITINKIDSFLNYIYNIQLKIDNVYREMKIRKRFSKFNIEKIVYLKKIFVLYISTFHHILNINQALTILVQEIEEKNLRNKYLSFFTKFEDSLLYISEIIIDKFENINQTIDTNDKSILKNKQIEKIQEIDILFKGILIELQTTFCEQHKDFFLELIAIGRNLKDIGTNLNKIEELLKELLE
jgi:hypothetical protein